MRIEDYRFGSMRIDGTTYRQDLKIINNEVKPDWRRKSGHIVTIEDLADITGAEPEIVVLGQGSPGQMKPEPQVEKELGKKGIKLIVKPTEEAAKEFNRLWQEGKKIAAGFHLTC